MTGYPPGLLQDDDPRLSKWLASRLDARRIVREVCMEMQMSDLQIVIDLVIEQIKKDIEAEDVTAIAAMLESVPMDCLVGYLPENTWEIES